MGIALIAVIVFLLAGILYYRAYARHEKLYASQLISLRPNIVSHHDCKEDFVVEISNYKTTNDVIDSIESNIKKLPFPIPSIPDANESAESIVGELTTFIDENSLGFAGTEPFILAVFSPGQITGSTIHALKNMVSPSSPVSTENVVSIKTKLEEGVANFTAGIREVRLLDSNKTSIDDSINNFLWDLFGTGTDLGELFAKALRQTSDEYHSELNQMLADTKNCAAQSAEQVRSVAVCTKNTFIHYLTAVPAPRCDHSTVIAMTKKLTAAFLEDFQDYHQQLENLKKSKFASKYKAVIDEMSLQIHGIDGQMPSECEINNHPAQSLNKIVELPFLKDKKFQNELLSSFKELKKLVETHRTALLRWSMGTSFLYNQSIFEVVSELEIQAENYKKKCLQWKQILNQKKRLIEEELEYASQLISHRPDIVSRHDCKEDFVVEISNYKTTNDVIDAIGRNIKELYFPIPSPPDSGESGENIVRKLATFIDRNSLAFAGTEQFVLAVFPPEQIVEFTIYALNSMVSHASQASMESLVSIKTQLATRVASLQDMEATEILVECLKKIFAHYSVAANRAMLVLKYSENKYSAAWSFVKDSTINILELDKCLPEIKASWANHGQEALSEIGSFELEIDPSGSFPVVTLFMSGLREVNLLRSGKTSLENSIKNGILDVAGTGLGAWGGAKLGAGIGSVFGPFGTVVGGVAGGIGGAILVRAGTNRIKHKNLDEAMNEYRSRFDQMLADTKNCAIQSVEQVRSVAVRKHNEFMENVAAAPAPRFENSTVIAMTKKLTASFQEDFQSYYQQFENLKKSKFSSKYRAVIDEMGLRMNGINRQMPSEYEMNSYPEQSLNKVVELPFLKDKKFQNELLSSFKELKEFIEIHRAVLLRWSMGIGCLYNQSISGVVSELEIQAKNYEKKCSNWKEILDKRKQQVEIEKGKLGIK